jgi:hypothetical protein
MDIVPAREFSDPCSLFVLMKSNDRLLHRAVAYCMNTKAPGNFSSLALLYFRGLGG